MPQPLTNGFLPVYVAKRGVEDLPHNGHLATLSILGSRSVYSLCRLRHKRTYLSRLSGNEFTACSAPLVLFCRRRLPNTTGMVQYKLIYFDVRGAGEAIRMIFHYAKEKFEDVRVEQAKWDKLKPSKLPSVKFLTLTERAS